jgi:TetR/AcrR family transcriptional regulator, transcriptional repressor of bet genes
MATRQTFFRAAPDARKQSLIEATALCLAERGVSATSVRSICAQAGVSSGLLRHYFTGIDDLIAATYIWTGERVQNALLSAVDHAPDSPRARLLAYVTASFRSPIVDPDLLATWLAFWSLTKNNPAIAQVHAKIYRDYRQGIETLIAATDPHRNDNRLNAVALTALVDGLWLELSLGDAPFSADEACALAERWLDTLLS